ncbi:hypothetical protein Droror1_Dr00005319 [Drosera rotundifolia]
MFKINVPKYVRQENTSRVRDQMLLLLYTLAGLATRETRFIVNRQSIIAESIRSSGLADIDGASAPCGFANEQSTNNKGNNGIVLKGNETGGFFICHGGIHGTFPGDLMKHFIDSTIVLFGCAFSPLVEITVLPMWTPHLILPPMKCFIKSPRKIRNPCAICHGPLAISMM